MTVSVIIPVYNVKNYLQRCLDSVLANTKTNLEIILVDDGSKDESGDICDRYAREHSIVKVVHKSNGGLASARNAGLDIASGDYICFVDSDDFLENGMIDCLAERIRGNDAIFCKYAIYDNDLGRYNEIETKEGDLTAYEYLLGILGSKPDSKMDCDYKMSVWGGLFRKSIIDELSLRFLSEREYMCEDLPFDCAYFQRAKTVHITNLTTYFYCMNSQSLVHTFNPNRFEKEKKLFGLVSSKITEDQMMRFERLFLGRVRNTIVAICKNNKYGKKQKIEEIQNIIRDSVVCRVLRSYPIGQLPFKQKVFGYFMKHKNAFVLYYLGIMR